MTKLLETIYYSSPAVVQDLGISLYGLKLYLREYGRKFNRLLTEFEKHLKFSAGDLEGYQSERFRDLITHCYMNVSYYRRVMDERGLKPTDFRSINDIAKLPILTREQFSRCSEELIASNVRRSTLVVGHTSGTTANPLQIVWDRQVCMIKTVVDWRQKRIAGVNPFDRIAYIIGRQIVKAQSQHPPFWRHNRVLNHLFFSAFHLAEKNLDHYFDRLAKFQPRAIEGFPSTLHYLATHLNRRNLSFPVRAVFTSAEPLLTVQRAAIEKAFQCKVFDFLGMSERVLFATECHQHDGKHLNGDFGYTEIIGDGTERETELGRIVATGLHNYAQPLIRYQTSDVSAFYAEPCACGLAFPRIQDVTTRDEDIVTTPDGRYLSPSALGTATKDVDTVEHIQIRQTDLHNIELRLVPRPTFTNADADRMAESLRQILGDQMSVKVMVVDEIPRTKSGKFRWVISEVPLRF